MTDGAFVKKIAGGTGTPVTIASGFSVNGATGLAFAANGDMYVTDSYNNAVKMIPGGPGSPATISSGFMPFGSVVVGANGDAYVVDKTNNEIKRFPGGSGSPVTFLSGLGANLYCMAFAQNGDLLVGQGGAVKRLDPVMGTLISTLYTSFRYIMSVFASANGDIYWSESDTMGQIWHLPSGSSTPVSVTGLLPHGMGGIFVTANGDIYAPHTTGSSVGVKKYSSGSSSGSSVGGSGLVSPLRVWVVC